MSYNPSTGGMAIGGTVTSSTPGSLLYVNSSNQLAQDNSNLFYDATNKRLAIKSGTSPSATAQAGAWANWGSTTHDYGFKLSSTSSYGFLIQGSADDSVLLISDQVAASFLISTSADSSGSNKKIIIRPGGTSNLLLCDNASGKVGVGTASPTAKYLTVGGFSNWGSTTYDMGVKISSTSSYGFLIQKSADDSVLSIHDQVPGTFVITTSADSSGSSQKITIRPGGSSDLLLCDSGSGKVGIGTATPAAKIHGTTSTIVGCASSANADGDLGNSQVNFWVNEGGNALTFKVKYSSGTVKSGTVALT